MQSSGVTDATAPAGERRVDTPEGRVFVRQIPGEDPALVLMHGFPDDHRIYDKLLPRLSPRRAVAFDFLGYGRSDRPDAAGFSPEEHGSQLTAVLDELGITRAVLVGHDASGPDAVFYAVAHPERVARLVLLNTVFGHQPSLRMPEMTRLFSEPDLALLADDMMSDQNQRLWLLQRWGVQMDLDPGDPEGLGLRSILPQFFGDARFTPGKTGSHARGPPRPQAPPPGDRRSRDVPQCGMSEHLPGPQELRYLEREWCTL